MMDTLVLFGREADRFLRMSMSKKSVRFQKVIVGICVLIVIFLSQSK